jgi:transcriptional activator SPT8
MDHPNGAGEPPSLFPSNDDDCDDCDDDDGEIDGDDGEIDGDDGDDDDDDDGEIDDGDCDGDFVEEESSSSPPSLFAHGTSILIKSDRVQTSVTFSTFNNGLNNPKS